MSSNPYTILCIDDEECILKSLERTLKPEGYNIITAQSGAEGLTVLEENAIDLVISDQRMPNMPGSEFFRKVRESFPHVVRIMLSGYSDFDSLVTSINDGEIFRFIAKPWDNDDLRQVIKTALEQKKVINFIQNIIKDVREISNISEGFSIETSQDQRNINLKIIDRSNTLSREVIFKFLNFLFKSLNVDKEDSVHVVSTAVQRQEGSLFIKIDVGNGVMLNIEMPEVENMMD